MNLESLREFHPEIQGPHDYRAALKAIANSVLKGGVYVIMPEDWAWVYVGSTASVSRRLGEHVYALRHQRHPKYEIQRDFTDEVKIMYCYGFCNTREEAFALEQKLLELFKDHSGLLNVATDAEKPWERGEMYVNPLKGKVRDPSVGKKVSETAKAQYADGREVPFRGKKHTVQTKCLLSEKAMGRKATEETKAKLSAQRGLGKNARAKAVVINGVEYDCSKSASIALNIPYPTVHWRVNTTSPEFSQWRLKDS